MINTTDTTLRPWDNPAVPIQPPAPTPAETQADLVVENANLRQENTELHELIGMQRQMIDTLQRQARKLRLSLMQAQGAASLLLAALTIHDDETPAY